MDRRRVEHAGLHLALNGADEMEDERAGLSRIQPQLCRRRCEAGFVRLDRGLRRAVALDPGG